MISQTFLPQSSAPARRAPSSLAQKLAGFLRYNFQPARIYLDSGEDRQQEVQAQEVEAEGDGECAGELEVVHDILLIPFSPGMSLAGPSGFSAPQSNNRAFGVRHQAADR